ncbi:MAG: MerR family transcriptional regulator [Fibrobacterota bacterium]
MYYKLGDFCRLTGLTRKALLLYEKKELLLPSKVDSQTGYRYYSDSDIILGSKIAFLRSLDFNINEIFDVLVKGNKAFTTLITCKKAFLLAKYQKISHALYACNINEPKIEPMFPTIIESSMYYSHIITLEGEGSSKDVCSHTQILMHYFKRYGYKLIDSPFVLYYKNSIPNHLKFKICFPVKPVQIIHKPGIKIESFSQKRVLQTRHFGSYTTLHISYKRLEKICTDMNTDITGEFVEIYKTSKINSHIKDETTLITDIGAVLC